MIPHRRGDDGYFMLQLTPPGAAGDWERPLMPNGEPLQLLILADTSASMDAGQRATQNDVHRVAARRPDAEGHVQPRRLRRELRLGLRQASRRRTPANIAAVARFSGQTHVARLDRSRQGVRLGPASSARPETHVIYVGDGIVTTGDADPVAFAKRLQRLYEGKAGTFHAVTVGSSYEPAVLKAIASLGGGSVRQDHRRARPAGRRPGTAQRDRHSRRCATSRSSSRGFKAARVYPEELPNVPAGTQQILLGRYLPEGKDQAGEIIVTGTQGGKPVRFSIEGVAQGRRAGQLVHPAALGADAPRQLLEQGTSDAIKDEIIALSEEYQIITPYTSLLVLESDADRERFKVKRRFQMRDGEKFFAEGRDNAIFDLKQKQMKTGRRLAHCALRRSVLSELAGWAAIRGLFQAGRPGYRRAARRSMDQYETTSSGGRMNPELA